MHGRWHEPRHPIEVRRFDAAGRLQEEPLGHAPDGIALRGVAVVNALVSSSVDEALTDAALRIEALSSRVNALEKQLHRKVSAKEAKPVIAKEARKAKRAAKSK
jgi:hypothetical protein